MWRWLRNSGAVGHPRVVAGGGGSRFLVLQYEGAAPTGYHANLLGACIAAWIPKPNVWKAQLDSETRHVHQGSPSGRLTIWLRRNFVFWYASMRKPPRVSALRVWPKRFA